MDPILAISSLVIAGAQAASKDIGGQVVKDLYGELKTALSRLLGGEAKVQAIEASPNSAAAQADLMTAMRQADASANTEFTQLAEALASALEEVGRGRPRPGRDRDRQC